MRRLRSTLFLLMLLTLITGVLPERAVQAQTRADSGGKSTPFGISGNLGNRVRRDEQATMIKLMTEAGVQWSREEISWERVQLTQHGDFRWGGDETGLYDYDQAIALQRGAGINVLGLLAYNPAWFKSKNPVLDAWIGDWGDYVYNTVARYGRERKQIKFWEVWNEPNLRSSGYEHGLYTVQEFVRILQVAKAAINAADPEAVIVMGGVVDIYSEIPTEHDYDSLDYLRLVYEAGGWNYFDILSLHPYRPAAPEAVIHRREVDMSFQQELAILDGMLNEFGRKPVWLTEMGWSNYVGLFGVSETVQAAYLQRLFMLALAHPAVEKIFWYGMRDDISPGTPYDRPAYHENDDQLHYGLLRRTYPLRLNDPRLRKPSFLAYRAMTDALQGMWLESVASDGVQGNLPGVFWYRYTNGQHRTDVMWRLYGDDVELEVPCDCREARVRRWEGTLLKVTMTGTGTVLGTVDDIGMPIFVESGPDKRQGGQFISETGHYLGGAFATRWYESGGLALYGYPITGELIEPDPQTGAARIVQYFERNRFDYFPEHAGTPFVVQYGRLGDEALRRTGVAWEKLPRRPNADENCLYFNVTGRQLCSPFRERWENTGGLEQHGLPLTDAYDESGTLVQYFERSRFEWHPANPPDFQIQLGLLSRELYATWGRWH